MTSRATGVYQIRNIINGKRYVGSALGKRGLLGRWHNHLSCLRRGLHHNQYLQRAWNKYGADAFVFEVLTICHPDGCLTLEQRFLDTGWFEYNIFSHVVDSRGYKHTEETKARISAKHMGKKFSNISRAKMSKAKRYGGNGGAKITVDNVREIRKLLTLGIPQADIATRFGITRYVVTDIKRGKTWSYVI